MSSTQNLFKVVCWPRLPKKCDPMDAVGLWGRKDPAKIGPTPEQFNQVVDWMEELQEILDYTLTVDGSACGMPLFTPGVVPYADATGLLVDSNVWWNGASLRIVGDLLVDGLNIGITADPDLLALTDSQLQVNGFLYVYPGGYEKQSSRFAGHSVWGAAASSRGSAVISSPFSQAGASSRRVMFGNNLRYDTTVVAGTHVQYQKESNVIGASGIAMNAPNADTGTMEFLLSADTDDDAWVVTTGMILDSAGLGIVAGDLGLDPTYRLYLDGNARTGDTYIYEHAFGNIQAFVAGGNIQFEVFTNHLWVDPSAYALVANGDLSFHSTRVAPAARIGETTRYLTGQIDEDHATFTVTATAAETTVMSAAIHTDDFAVGKTWHVAISGYCVFPGSGVGVTHSSTLKIKLAGVTLYSEQMMFIPVSSPGGTTRWVVRADISTWSLGAGGSCAFGVTMQHVNTGGASVIAIPGSGVLAINTTANRTLDVTITHDDNDAAKFTYVYVRETLES